MSLKTVPTASLKTLLRALHKAQIPCPLRADTLACIGLQERQEPILAALRGLDESGVRAVLVNVIAERKGAHDA